MTRTIVLLPFLAGLAQAQCTLPAEIATLNREQVRSQIAAGHGGFLHYKRLLDHTSLRPKPGVLAPEFQKLYDAHPNDAHFAYLSGRALLGKNTPEAITRLREAVSLDPKLPWTYTALAEIYSSPNFKDETSLLDAARNFRKVCPANVEGFRYLDHLKDAQEAGVQAAQLRRVLEAGAAPDEGRYWRLLWGAEFRSAPESTYPELRKRVAADLHRLKSRPERQQIAFRGALVEGYNLIGQTEEAARIEDSIEAAGAQIYQESRALEDKYGFRTRKDIPSREERDAFMRERGAWAAEWVRKHPSSFFASTMLLSSVPFTPNWTKEDLERAGERVVELDAQRDFGWTYVSEKLRVAQIWIRYGVRLKDSLRMAEDALAEFSLGPEEANDLTANSNTAHSLASQRYGFDSSMWEAMGAVVDASLQLNDAVKARSMLGQMQNWLVENQERRSEPGSGYEGFQNLETIYTGKMAEAEGRKLDALALYIKAISTRWARDDVMDHVKELWLQQGGRMETWAAVTSRRALPKPAVSKTTAAPAFTLGGFEKMDRPLPQFQLRDAAGKVWTLDQLKGKRTFVTIWATWCGPCRQEFPSVQKLYELAQGREDVQVITLNVDAENPGLVAPFLSANHVVTPVLLDARSYVMDFIGMLSMPQNWLVDRNGVLRAKAHGFDENLKDWPTRMLEQLENLQ